MKKFKIIFLLVGLIFFSFLIYKVGIENITDSLKLVGWKFFIIFALYFIHYTVQNIAWAVEMRKTFREVGFLNLYKARIAGEAMNGLIPLGNLGGEPVKAYLLDDRASRTEIVASLILDKTVFSFGALLYVFTGLIIAVTILGAFSLEMKIIIFMVLALMIWGLIVFVRRRNFFSNFFEKLKRYGIARKFITKRMDAIKKMDTRIASFYRSNKRRFAAALILHYAAKLLQALEFYLIFKYLGLELTFAHAICINSLSIIIHTIFFFMPGHWGIAEGAQAFIFLALGLDPAHGVSVGVVRRVRHMFWTTLGLGIFYFSEPHKKKEVLKDISLENNDQNGGVNGNEVR